MSGVLNQGFPNRVSGFLNPDGTLQDVWFRFFRSLWIRTGGGTAPGTIDEITAFVVMDDTLPEVSPDPAALLAWLISDTPDEVVQDFAYFMALVAIDEPAPPENDPALLAAMMSDTPEGMASGLWTPQLQFGGASVGMTGSFSGWWRRIGDAVYVQAEVALSNKGASVGNSRTVGLPFLVRANSNFRMQMGLAGNFAGTIAVEPTLIAIAGTDRVGIYTATWPIATALVQETEFTNTSAFQYSGWYLTG